MRTDHLVLAGALALAVIVGVGSWLVGLPSPAAITAGVTVLCAVLWVLEPIPIPVTSLIPFVVLPLTGVLDHEAIGQALGHTLILLLLGGFILSSALERSGAHKRLALAMVRLVGRRGPRGLVLGFMLAAAVCSMWISNTATTLMLLPVALAVLSDHHHPELETPLLLGIAYAASIGGMGTPVGTPPNVIFLGVYKEMVHQQVSFLRWMSIAVPVVAVFIPLAWWWLVRKVPRGEPIRPGGLGPWRPAEVRVLIVFGLTALAWVLRTDPYGGWTHWFHATGAGDSTVALAACVLLFVIPDGEGGRMLDWKTAERIPWGLLLLFAGGIALARAFKSSGLSEVLGQQLSGLSHWPTLLMVAAVCLAVTFLTEVTSNTATTTLLMPILAEAGKAAHIDPILLMVPATLSASCAFMLPVATAPNAVMFSTGRVPTRRMAREGLALNFIGAAAITLITWTLLR